LLIGLTALRSVPCGLDERSFGTRGFKQTLPQARVLQVKRSLSEAKSLCGVLFESRRMRDAHIRRLKKYKSSNFWKLLLKEYFCLVN
jgi:hypothetical protein